MPVLTCTTVWLVYSVFMIVNSSTTNNFNTFDVTLGEEERVEQPTPFYSHIQHGYMFGLAVEMCWLALGGPFPLLMHE